MNKQNIPRILQDIVPLGPLPKKGLSCTDSVLTVRNMVGISLCVQDDMFSPASLPIPPIISSAEKKAIDNDRKENELSEKKK